MQIHYAARRGDREAVLKQLARGISINAREENSGATPLMAAAGSLKADAAFLGFLLEHGASINAVSVESYGGDSTALMQAARSGDPTKVDILLQSGADVHFRSRSGYTALITGSPASPAVTRTLLDAGAETDGETLWYESALSVASRESCWPVVRILLDAGADPAPLHWTPLLHTVVFGSVEDVAAELAVGADLTAQDRWERTPWLHAVCVGDVDKARLLMERGSDIYAHGRGGDTALMYAAMRDDAPMAEWILSLGINVNEATEFGDTALHAAAEHGAVHVIPVLLAAGAEVHASNQVQTQPIDEASEIETVRLLANAGADVNYVNGQGYWLLKSAAEAGNIEFARDLLALGASVETTSTGETALHSAVKEDALDIIRLLLDAGAGPNAQDVDGWGLLWFVRTIEAVEILLQAGIDVHLTDDMGQEALANQTDPEIQAQLITAGCHLNPPGIDYGAPLLTAVERGDASQVGFLLDAGAVVNTQTGWGQTPLMEAAENSFVKGVQMLLNAGADVFLQDSDGRTALHHAAAPEAFSAYALAQRAESSEWGQWMKEFDDSHSESLRDLLNEQPNDLFQYGYVESDSVECLNMLVQAGADINAADNAGLTPLSLAASCGRPARVAGLLALGADVKDALAHAEAHPNTEQKEQIITFLRTAEQKEPDGAA